MKIKPPQSAIRSARGTAARIVDVVIHKGQALDDACIQFLPTLAAADHGLTKALCFAALRAGRRSDQRIFNACRKPPSTLLRALLWVGYAELSTMSTAAYAAVDQLVEATAELGLEHARGLVNALMREHCREPDALADALDPLPEWVQRALQDAWPQAYADIVRESMAPGPMWLRVNLQRGSTADYRARLSAAGIEASAAQVQGAPAALQLERGVGVEALPGFADGDVSVQDVAAQWSTTLLDATPGMRVLDACSAPGGKACAILERTNVELVSVDISARRQRKTQESLRRLGLTADIRTLDLLHDDGATLGQFDRILLDAPCTALGVIRRHPDMLYLRRSSDLATTVALQAALLRRCWTMLRAGGRLLYATCSILPAENAEQMKAFLVEQKDASLCAWPWPDLGIDTGFGRQILPGMAQADGFFYAELARQCA